MLGRAKYLVKPTLGLSESITRQPWKTSNVENFASIYLNLNYYIFFQDYINERFDPSEGADVKFWEIMDMIKIWILQFYYGTTSTHLFYGKEVWYANTKDVSLTKYWYAFIIKNLVSDLPALDIYEGTEEQENKGNAIWGNFYQFNPIVSKLEQHVADICQRFILPNIDLRIDGDKLRHSGSRFR